MKNDGAVVEAATRNDGVIALRDLRTLNISRKTRQRLVGQGVLVPVSSHVYLLGGLELTRHRQLRVALAEAGPDAAVSHHSAGTMWELPGIWADTIDVSIPRHETLPARTIGTIYQSRWWPPEHRTILDGLAITTPERTLLDLSSRLLPDHLDHCLQELARRELASVVSFRSALDEWRRRGRNGVRRSEESADRHQPIPRADSWLEARFLRTLVKLGIELPETQADIHAGDRRYRVDALWRTHRLVAEVNGAATHSSVTDLGHDASRTADLMACGYRVVAFTYRQIVDDPHQVAGHLRLLLRASA